MGASLKMSTASFDSSPLSKSEERLSNWRTITIHQTTRTNTKRCVNLCLTRLTAVAHRVAAREESYTFQLVPPPYCSGPMMGPSPMTK